MHCPYCKQECKSDTVYCPHCFKLLVEPEGAESSTVQNKTGEWKYSIMLNMLKTDWKILVVIVILALGIPALLSYNTSKKDETVIGQAKLFLAEGYSDNEELSKVTWGRVNEAKLLLLKLSDNSSVRKEADSLAAEIAARETGIAIVDAQKIIENDTITELDIQRAKNIKEIFTYVQVTNRYYQQAKELSPEFTEILDASLLARAKRNIEQSKIQEARNDLADISTQSLYANAAKLVNDQLCETERVLKKMEEIQKRKQYARSIEDDLTSKSKMNILVTTSGDNSEYLTVRYKLLARSLLKKYSDEDKIISTAQELGFKRVTFNAEDEDAWKDK
ncbi:hypothetical protein [Pelosinus sp. sgz500959]|uniref:hypothetical protein n=1 Tax=Pelosinus sp. sgz500959 TaxID=3242472 RepID=UPI00366F03F3